MSDIYTMPGHLIRRLQQISSSVFAQHMKDLGMDLTSPQFAALTVIEAYPSIDQATLAGAIAFDRATIGGVVDRLVSKGFVERVTNPKDRRARVLTLTPKGEAILVRLRPVVKTSQDAILSCLADHEKSDFLRLAAKIATSANALSRAPLHLPEPKGSRSNTKDTLAQFEDGHTH